MDRIFYLSLFLLSGLLQAATYTNRPLGRDFGITFEYDEKNWEVVEPTVAQLKSDADTKVIQSTLVNIQRKTADEKYRSRFNIVQDSIGHLKNTTTPKLLQYQNHALEFMKSQRFQVLSVETVQLPQVTEKAFEITARQRDFGLTFRQVGLIHEDQAYLLTLATRTPKFESYLLETAMFFDTFKFEGQKKIN